MSEWREYIISDIATLIKDSRKVGDEKLPYLGLEHIEEAKLRLNSIGSSDDVASNKYHFSSGDVLFGKLRPYFRKVVKPNFDGICSTDIWVINATDKSDIDFILYFFSNQELIDLSYSSSSGTRMPRADWKFLSQTLWDIPPLKEQKAIAEVLSSLDDKIDLLHRQNKTLEELAQTLFRQWFIEEAKDEWEMGTLETFADNPRNSIKPSQITFDMKYIGLEHIQRKNISLVKSGNAEEVASNKYAFKENDILFGKLRPYFHKVCFTAHNGICSTDILVLRPKETKYFAFILFAFFQTDVINYANSGSEGTRMPRTNWNTLKEFIIQIPSDNVIEKFNLQVLSMIEKIKKNQQQIRTLENMRDTLLPKLMSGEVRVND